MSSGRVMPNSAANRACVQPGQWRSICDAERSHKREPIARWPEYATDWYRALVRMLACDNTRGNLAQWRTVAGYQIVTEFELFKFVMCKAVAIARFGRSSDLVG